MNLSGLFGDQLASVRNAVRTGRYQLVIGAGASIGAKNAAGPLPDAEGLVKRLEQKYPAARIGATLKLPRAYQRAVQVSNADDVWRFLKEIFSNCTHGDWFTTLTGLPWRRVWTLNIDDAFERAYKSSVRFRHANLRIINWVDDYVEPRGAEVVHLHGTVSGSKPTPIVFSMSEYHAAAEAQSVWHKVLAGVLSSEPIVILGARILDDIDVERIVLGARPLGTVPSIIVDPFISDDNAWELESAGFLIYRGTGEQWVQDWVEIFGLEDVDLDKIYASRVVNLPQIQELRTDHVVPAPFSHDLLGGSEPLWSDASNGYIARFSWMDDVIDGIRRWSISANPEVAVRVSYVPRLGGASTGMMLVARTLAQLGVRVLYFDRSIRFDIQRLLDICEGSDPVLLLIDGGHSFADDIDKLARKASALKEIPLFVWLLDRPNQAGIIEDNLSEDKYSLCVEHVALRRSQKDSKAIVRLLQYQGRMGTLESLPNNQRLAHFLHRDIFSAMSEVEHGAGFHARLDREVRQLTTPWHAHLVLLLTLASDGGAQVSLVEAAFALDTVVESILAAIVSNDHLGALVELDGEILHARHRLRSVNALVAGEEGERFVSMVATMLQRLSSLIPRDGSARTRGSSLVRHLMSARMLLDVFPRVDASVLYQSILPHYGEWNARYWEQRSIYARRTSEWDQAVSFAERAVTVWDDSFTRNTLAVNLLAKATDMSKREDSEWVTYYRRARNEFQSALDRDRSASVARWAQLSATLALIATLADRATKDRLRESADEVLDDWMSAYAEYRVNLPGIQGSKSASDAVRLSQKFTLHRAAIDDRVGTSTTSVEALRSTVADAINGEYLRLSDPLPLSSFAAKVQKLLDERSREEWGGFGTFKQAVMEVLPEAVITAERGGTLHARGAPMQSRSHGAAAANRERLDAAIKQAVGNLERPTTLAAIAYQVNRTLGSDVTSDWAGYGKFKDALLGALPSVQILNNAPGYVVPEGDERQTDMHL